MFKSEKTQVVKDYYNIAEGEFHYDEWVSATVRRCSATDTDVELSYHTIGDPSKPTVLLIMGLSFQGIVWDPNLCRMIADRGFHVVRFDNRDVGKSTTFDHVHHDPVWKLLLPKCFWNPPPYTLSDMAADAVALLDHLKVDRAHWVGVSMGGMISQVATIEYPERVLSLTSIMSSTGNPSLPDPPIWVAPEFLKQPKSHSVDDVVEHQLSMTKNILMHRCRIDDTYLRTRAMVSVNRSRYRRGLDRQLLAIKTAPCRDAELSRVRIPTVVIHGDRDVLVPTSHGTHTGSVIPGAKTVIVDEMGHWILPDQFELLVSEIVRVAEMATVA